VTFTQRQPTYQNLVNARNLPEKNPSFIQSLIPISQIKVGKICTVLEKGKERTSLIGALRL